MKNQAQLTPALWLPKQDAEYVLEPVAKALLAAGVPRRKAQAALKGAAHRALRLAAQDAGLPVGPAKKEAQRVARLLVA